METKMETGTALALPAPTELASLYSAQGGLDPIIARIEAEVRAHVADVTTKKGRDAIASLAYRVARSKTTLDDAGKALVEDVKRQVAKVDAERRKVRERLDALRDEARAPLDAWEAAEKSRLDGIRERIARIEAAPGRPLASSGECAELIARIEAVALDDSFAEFLAEAAKAKDAALYTLRQTFSAMAQREAEAAELARLRAEAAAREEADRLRREAEEAERRRVEAERAEAERAARIEREKQEAAERAAREAEERAAAQAEAERRATAEREAALQRQIEEAKAREEAAAQRERARIAAEKLAEEQARIKREADQAHRAKVRAEIAAALSQMAGNATLERIADALMAGQIPHCKVVL